MLRFALGIALIVWIPSQALGQQPAAPPAPPQPAFGYAQTGHGQAPTTPIELTDTDRLHDFSLTISPIHLLFPIVELTGEFRVGNQLGIAAIAGGGSMSVTNFTGEELSFTVLEFGSQVRWYALGDFDHGMQLGAELLYIYVSGSFERGSVTGTGSGLAMGPFIGYKISTDVGFTFDAQLGVQLAGIAARASDGTTAAEASDMQAIPLLNLNAGWAF
jgi:hypothetical protein